VRTIPAARRTDNQMLGAPEMQLLKDLCGNNRLHYELTQELFSITRQFRRPRRRHQPGPVTRIRA